MTKEELLYENSKMKQKLEEQTHLAEAVKAKDEEIFALKKALENEKASTIHLTKKVEEQSHLAEAVKAKDAEIVLQRTKHEETLKKIRENNENQVSELSNKIKEFSSKSNESLPKDKEIISTLVQENQRLVGFINNYKDTFKSFLKASQGSLENAIQLENIQYNALLSTANPKKEGSK